MDDLDHHFAGLDGIEHVASERLGLDRIGELLGDLIVYVGVEQSPAYVLERLRYIYFCDFALTFQELEASLESFA